MGRPTAAQTEAALAEYLKSCKASGIKPLEKASRMGTRIKHRCHCGEVWRATPTKIMRKPRCNKCAVKEVAAVCSQRKGIAPGNKMVKADLVRKLKESGTSRFLIGDYLGMDKKNTFKCRDCKTTTESFPHNVMKFGCQTCAGGAKKTTSSHNKEIERFGIQLVGEYAGARSRATYRCKCGFRWESTPTNLLKMPSCVKCTGSFHKVHTLKVKSKFFQVRSIGELRVLECLVRKFGAEGVRADKSCGTPTISTGRGRRHRPDFYLPSKNSLVEVKNLGSAGLSNRCFYGKGKTLWADLQRKKKSATEAGYHYKAAVVKACRSSTQLAVLPKGWENLSRRQVLDRLEWTELSVRALGRLP